MNSNPLPMAFRAIFVALIMVGCGGVAGHEPSTSLEPSETPTPLPSSTPTRTETPIRPTLRPSQTPITNPEDGKIAYVSCNSDGGNCGIHVMNADGSGPVRLANDSGLEYYNAPDWSPDGTRLVFEGAHATAGDGIYIMDADGSNLRWLSNNNNLTWDDAPAWSPDGENIAFVSYPELASTKPGGRSLASPVIAAAPPGEIYVMKADGSDPVRLTDDLAYDSAPAWSPDGKRIVFLSDRDGPSEIYVMEADGSNPVRLTFNQMWEDSPVWSPDGMYIAFAESGILVMDADGSDLIQLTHHGRGPDWSPDGTKLVFTVEREGEAQIYVMNADGSGETDLTKSHLWNHSPAWGPAMQAVDIRPAMTPLPDCTSGWTRLEAGNEAKVSEYSPIPNRIRSEPTLSGEILSRINPGTIVRILEGPVCADGFVFWKVESAVIPTVVGWTAEGDGAEYYLVPYAWGIGRWSETTPIPIASAAPFDNRGQQLIFHNDYIYVFGGSEAFESSTLTNVYYAAVNPNGTLAAWVETTSLPGQYHDHVVVKVGNYVYLITGAAGDDAVYYAPINPNGSTGTWIRTAPLTPSRQNFAAINYGNYLYATGGDSGGTRSFVEYTSANLDGTLNPWADTTPLPEAIQGHTMVAYDGYLYVMAPNSHVYYALINPDGTVGSWNTTTPLPEAISRYSSFEYNGFICILGGGYSSYCAPVLEDHSLGAWQSTTPLPVLRYGLRTGANSNYVYAMGGYDSTNYQSTVYYAPLEDSGK